MGTYLLAAAVFLHALVVAVVWRRGLWRQAYLEGRREALLEAAARADDRCHVATATAPEGEMRFAVARGQVAYEIAGDLRAMAREVR